MPSKDHKSSDLDKQVEESAEAARRLAGGIRREAATDPGLARYFDAIANTDLDDLAPLSTARRRPHDIAPLSPLSEEELAKIPTITSEEIAALLAEGARQRKLAERSLRPGGRGRYP